MLNTKEKEWENFVKEQNEKLGEFYDNLSPTHFLIPFDIDKMENQEFLKEYIEKISFFYGNVSTVHLLITIDTSKNGALNILKVL